MKQRLLPVAILLMLIASCSDKERLQPNTEETAPRQITLSAWMPKEQISPTDPDTKTRISLTPDTKTPHGLELKWEEGDKLLFNFEYQDNFYETTATIRQGSISEDGLQATFTVTIPDAVPDNALFNLSAVYQKANALNPIGHFLENTNDYLVKNGDDQGITLNQPGGNGKGMVDPLLYFHRDDITALETVQLNHAGWIMALHFKNSGNTDISLPQKIVIGNSENTDWIWNGSGNESGLKFNPGTAAFGGDELLSGAISININSTEVQPLYGNQLAAGESIILYRWIAGKPDLPEMEGELFPGEGSHKTSGKMKAGKAVPGRVYHLFTEWNGTEFKWGTAPMPENVLPGINIIDNHTVTLVLYDNDTDNQKYDQAYVVGDFNNWTVNNSRNSQMRWDENSKCWWITIKDLEPTREYAFQYELHKGTSTLRVADPYSRKILDPWNDQYIPATTYPNLKAYPQGGDGIVSVFQTTPEAHNWEIAHFTPPSKDILTIYELHFRDFTASGDINGAMEKLDYLQSLGVNAIELMPVQEFDDNDSWGYNPCFYFALDKAYGTDKMYKQFIDECHKRGIAVIFDVVYNHATGATPFARMWWNSTTNKTAPNNPFFNEETKDPFEFFHDFNHGSPLVRNFVKRNLQFLLEEYKIDGLRFDFSKGFTQIKCYDDACARQYHQDRVDIIKDYYGAIKEVKPDALVILEHFCEYSEEIELAQQGIMLWKNMNYPYCQTAMGWTDNSCFYPIWDREFYTNGLVSYMESHDEERASYKQTQWGNGPLKTDLTARMNQLAVNAAFFFTWPGPKMVWQFGELGYDYSIEYNGRTGKKPVKWDYYEVTQRKQLYDTYAKLIGLRRNHPELFSPDSHKIRSWVEVWDWDGGRFLTFASPDHAKQIVVVGNFTNNTIDAATQFPVTGTWYNYMNRSETLNVTDNNMNITVPANSFRIYSTFEP